jgi:seryl-tRNA synthetase
MRTPDGRIFSSWKEIAAFLGKGVRTVQRWEKTLGLPVRRPNGTASNVVVATENDLRRWMNEGGDQAIRNQAESDARDIRILEDQLARLEQAHTRLEQALERIESRFALIENSLVARETLEDVIVHSKETRKPEKDGSRGAKSDGHFKNSGDGDGNSSPRRS